MPTTFARTTASSVRGCCSMMAQTQSASTTAAATMTTLRIFPADFAGIARRVRGRRGRGRRVRRHRFLRMGALAISVRS